MAALDLCIECEEYDPSKANANLMNPHVNDQTGLGASYGLILDKSQPVPIFDDFGNIIGYGLAENVS